jgi:hypothetical protein
MAPWKNLPYAFFLRKMAGAPAPLPHRLTRRARAKPGEFAIFSYFGAFLRKIEK